jgi:hypothetical protein
LDYALQEQGLDYEKAVVDYEDSRAQIIDEQKKKKVCAVDRMTTTELIALVHLHRHRNLIQKNLKGLVIDILRYRKKPMTTLSERSMIVFKKRKVSHH